MFQYDCFLVVLPLNLSLWGHAPCSTSDKRLIVEEQTSSHQANIGMGGGEPDVKGGTKCGKRKVTLFSDDPHILFY